VAWASVFVRPAPAVRTGLANKSDFNVDWALNSIFAWALVICVLVMPSSSDTDRSSSPTSDDDDKKKRDKEATGFIGLCLAAVWQNRLNYSGSSALMITAQLRSAQRTSNGTIPWSVGSLPDTTTVQQDRSRFTSHEGEFTSQNSSSTFNLQPYVHYYKPSSKISKFIQPMFKLTSTTAYPNS
jgi:hypothetical protein